jgi:hypothetical protein
MIMGSDRLSVKERAALFALLAEARQLSNPEFEERVGFRLDGADRRRLNDLKLVKSDRQPGRAYVHELTAAGREWCANELSVGPDGHGTSMERALYAILGGLDRYLRRTGQSLSDVFNNDHHAALLSAEADVNSRIKAVYRELAQEPGDFVRLHELRMKLPDISRADLDFALDNMYQDQQINLVAQANQEALSDADRESALLIGGSRKHRISIERL